MVHILLSQSLSHFSTFSNITLSLCHGWLVDPESSEHATVLHVKMLQLGYVIVWPLHQMCLHSFVTFAALYLGMHYLYVIDTPAKAVSLYLTSTLVSHEYKFVSHLWKILFPLSSCSPSLNMAHQSSTQSSPSVRSVASHRMVAQKGATAITRPFEKHQKVLSQSEAEHPPSSQEPSVIDIDTDINTVSEATVETDKQELGMSIGQSPFQSSHFDSDSRSPPENMAFMLRSWPWTPTNYLFLLSNLSTFYFTTWPPRFTQSYQCHRLPQVCLRFYFVHLWASFHIHCFIQLTYLMPCFTYYCCTIRPQISYRYA